MSPKDNWDRVEIISKVAGSILIPIVVAWAVSEWSRKRAQEQGVTARVQLALQVLRGPAFVDGSDRALREWAVAVIQEPESTKLGTEPIQQLTRGVIRIAICDGTRDLRKDLAVALLKDGGEMTQLKGARLLSGLKAGCGEDR